MNLTFKPDVKSVRVYYPTISDQPWNDLVTMLDVKDFELMDDFTDRDLKSRKGLKRVRTELQGISSKKSYLYKYAQEVTNTHGAFIVTGEGVEVGRKGDIFLITSKTKGFLTKKDFENLYEEIG